MRFSGIYCGGHMTGSKCPPVFGNSPCSVLCIKSKEKERMGPRSRGRRYTIWSSHRGSSDPGTEMIVPWMLPALSAYSMRRCNRFTRTPPTNSNQMITVSVEADGVDLFVDIPVAVIHSHALWLGKNMQMSLFQVYKTPPMHPPPCCLQMYK